MGSDFLLFTPLIRGWFPVGNLWFCLEASASELLLSLKPPTASWPSNPAPGLYEEAEIKKSGPKWPKRSTVEWVKSGFGATKLGDPGHKKRDIRGIYSGFHKWGYPKILG